MRPMSSALAPARTCGSSTCCRWRAAAAATGPPGRPLESETYEGHINGQSLGSMMMTDHRAPILAKGDGSFVSMLHAVRFAYHIENRRFVRYLKEESERAGVKHVDATIVDALL